MRRLFMWAYHSIFYQIYPIGFCGAPVHNDGQTVSRIRKLLDWTDYLADLGVDSILLNPVFESDNHGYDTRDFRKIDCRLGTNEDFAGVCRSLHAKGIRVVLDGVFNHVGRGFWAFQDVQEKKWDSPYKDWFYINFDGNSGYDDGFWYEGWEGHYELVKLNLKNPAVVDYLLDCVRFWIETFEIDGLRLDVAYSLDHGFMRRLRSFCTELKPDFALIGEVLFGDYNQIVNDEMLHSCTNYECYKGLFSSFNDMNLFEIAHSLNRQFGPEQWCIYRGKHLMTFVDNHDVTRIASILKDKRHLYPVYGTLMTMPGIPCIYYGSEWGEEGIKAPDNDYALRPCFESPKPNEFTQYLRRLISFRQKSDALCNGSYRNVLITNRQLIFERKTDRERVFVAINAENSDFTANHGELQGEVQDLLEGERFHMNGQLTLKPYSVQILVFDPASHPEYDSACIHAWNEKETVQSCGALDSSSESRQDQTERLSLSDLTVVLGSASPRRTELLTQAGIEHTVLPSSCEERITSSRPEEVVQELARQKAENVYSTWRAAHPGESFLVIGSDTVVANNGQILGKPSGRGDAYQMISSLQNHIHQVYTGVSLILYNGTKEKTHTFYESSDVDVYPMSPEEIGAYLNTDEPYDKAGAYGIQGAFAVYIKGIHGDYNTIVGLPIARIYQELKRWIRF